MNKNRQIMESFTKRLMGEGLDKTSIKNLTNKYPEITNELKDSYYGVGDHIHNLLAHLDDAVKEDPSFKEELKLAQTLVKLYDRSQLGKYL